MNKQENTQTGRRKYRCEVCGFIHDPSEGDKENRVNSGLPFHQLPSAWICPVCGASVDDFKIVNE